MGAGASLGGDLRIVPTKWNDRTDRRRFRRPASERSFRLIETTVNPTTCADPTPGRHIQSSRVTPGVVHGVGPGGPACRDGRPPGSGAARATLGPMDDERWEPGMPVLDRQGVASAPGPRPAGAGAGANTGARATTLPPSLQGLPPRSVPETAPTPLQRHYVLLSVPVLVLGAIAITALELGASLGSSLVKLCVLIAAPLLVITTADAVVRIWRSAWAWMPVDRGKGLFRLAWVAVSLIGLTALCAAAVVVILA